jgi:segregation and condensation protein B
MNEDGAEAAAAMEEERLKAILESLLFAAGEPVALAQLANALDSVPREEIRRALAGMATDYANGNRGIMLDEVAGGYQLRTPREHAMYVRRLLAAKPPRLSRPLLETLAIIAYRQPITRPEIEQLRGVDTGGVLDTLSERGLIKIAGRKDAPGRPMMYSTTPEFLELFGLKDIDSLPDLEEFRAIEGMIDHAPERMAESMEAPARIGEAPSPEWAETTPVEEGAMTDASAAEPAEPVESIESAAAESPAEAEFVSQAEELSSDQQVASDTPGESPAAADESAPASPQVRERDDSDDDSEKPD